jgi:hypothetical protein
MAEFEKLDKIVALAKRGEGGEKEVALRMVKEICSREGLDFDDVMSDSPKTQEFYLSFSTAYEEDLLVQVICKFALLAYDSRVYSKRLSTGKRLKMLYFETTTEKYVDTMNAWRILRRKLKEELDKLPLAMTYKHGLFYQPTEEEREKMKKGNGDIDEKTLKAMRMAAGLDDVDLQRRLKA